jgi:YidC/Oxa1 family membrane protein insertase
VDKRLPLALFLSFLVIVGYYLLFAPREEPREGQGSGSTPESARPLGQEPRSDPAAGVAPASAQPGAVPAQPDAARVVPTLAESEERTLELVVGEPGTRGHLRLLFSNRGAALTEVDFGGYFRTVGLEGAARADRSNWLALLRPIHAAQGDTGSLVLKTSTSSDALAPAGLESALWTMRPLDAPQAGVEFRYAPGTGVLFTKRIVARPGTWELELTLALANEDAGVGGRRDFVLVPASCVVSELDDKFYPEPRVVAAARVDEEIELDDQAAPGLGREDVGADLSVPGPLAFAGAHNKYFAALLRPAAGSEASLLAARWRPVWPADPALGPLLSLDVPVALELPEPGASKEWSWHVYLGPKDPKEMELATPDFAAVYEEDLGYFALIGNVLLAVLRFFQGLVGNWGVAIILLTLCVRAALFPLNRRSQTTMARYATKMKRVQPLIEEAKRKFANDPQKAREAQARIMQEEGAFPPLGGCLPVLLQFPIFIGLFSALRTSFDLRQAPFCLWMDDLSRPDRLLRLDLSIPLGFTTLDLTYLNLLPILMVVLWILQQRGMPKPADEQAARMQKMMMFMPILFGFMLYGYAAGLSLYMITQSAMGIVEQKVIRKLWPLDDREPEKAKRGCGPFSGWLQHVAQKHKAELARIEAVQAQRRRDSERRRKR